MTHHLLLWGFLITGATVQMLNGLWPRGFKLVGDHTSIGDAFAEFVKKTYHFLEVGVGRAILMLSVVGVVWVGCCGGQRRFDIMDRLSCVEG